MNNNMQSLVSVIIPTHNRLNLLRRAIMSVIGQTYKNLEIVIVSDGSTDGTNESGDTLMEIDPRIKFFYFDKPRGGNVARNYGVSKSVGEYVAFLDDDDEWLPTKLERQLSIFNEDPKIGLVCTAYNYYDEETKKTKTITPKVKREASKQILYGNFIGSTTTVVVRTAVFKESGGFDEELPARQDYDLWIRLCQITYVGVVLEPCVIYYNSSSNDQVSWNYKKYEFAMEYMDKKYSDLYNNNLTKKELKKIISNERLSIARKALKCNLRKETRLFAKKALKIRFSIKGLLHYFSSFFPKRIVEKIYNKLG